MSPGGEAARDTSGTGGEGFQEANRWILLDGIGLNLHTDTKKTGATLKDETMRSKFTENPRSNLAPIVCAQK